MCLIHTIHLYVRKVKEQKLLKKNPGNKNVGKKVPIFGSPKEQNVNGNKL